MKFTGLALAVLSLTVMVKGPAFADVVPVRKSAEEKTAPVKDQLLSQGASTQTVERHVATLTSTELEFFAKDPAQIQAVGGLHLEQWLFGLLVFGTILGIYFMKISNHRGKGGR